MNFAVSVLKNRYTRVTSRIQGTAGKEAGVNESLQKLVSTVAQRSREAQLEIVRSMSDLQIPDAHRLTEMDRAQMVGIVSKLLHGIELDLRLNLAEALPAIGARRGDLLRVLADDRVELAQSVIGHHAAIMDLPLIQLVKARSDEHRLILSLREQAAFGMQQPVNGSAQNVIDALLRHREPNVSRRAMEYVVAETRRLDRFDEPILPLSELPLSVLERLVWMVCAALRVTLARDYHLPLADLDAGLQQAGRRLLLEQGDKQTLLGRTQRLAFQIDEVGELTDAFLLRCLRQQRVHLFVAGLAQRSNITFFSMWQIFTDKTLTSLTVLARAINMSREAVSAMLLALSDAWSGHDARAPERAIDLLSLFDEMAQSQAEAALKIWTRDPGYQAALDRLGAADEQPGDLHG